MLHISGSQMGVILPSGRYLTIFGVILGCHSWGGGWYWHLGMLLNILNIQSSLSATKNSPAPNVNSISEKLWFDMYYIVLTTILGEKYDSCYVKKALIGHVICTKSPG